jgi:agmatinase
MSGAPPDARLLPRFTGVRTFARLPHEPEPRGADVAVLGIPFDTGAVYRVGGRFGPEAIRSASALLRSFDHRGEVPVFERLTVVDAGDVAVVPGATDDSHARIQAHVGELLGRGTRVLGLGGDHSIALPELRAVAAAHGGPVGLLTFDSHTDTDDAYFGQPYTHGSPFWHAVQEGLIDPGRSIQVGLRGSLFAGDDYELARGLGIELIPAADVDDIGIDGVAARIRARLGSQPAFVSFDVDFLDPAFAPGTGTPEVGGFSTREALRLLRGLRGISIASADVVEVIPAYDVAQVTAMAAANVAFELLVLMAAVSPGTRLS